MKIRTLLPVIIVGIFLSVLPTFGADPLKILWIDVEGGAATLIVTPAKQAVLIDSGWGDGPSAARIHQAATNAGARKIDYLITTHFHLDHFGGAAPLAKLMPIGTVIDNGTAEPSDDQLNKWGKDYITFKADYRRVAEVGEEIPLKTADDSTTVHLRCMGARKRFFHLIGEKEHKNPYCTTTNKVAADPSDNANSSIFVLQFGNFKFFDGGDLTWNVEADLICPINSIGTVDVFQVDHHGMNLSNNPLLVRSLAPVVSLMDNGPRKGGSRETLATLRSVPSIKAMYQLHRDLRGGAEFNTDDQYIANIEEKCAGNLIECSVDPYGKNYTISIPATGHHQTFKAKYSAR